MTRSTDKTPNKISVDSKQIGLRFASSIESILRRLRLDRVSVREKDRERLNKCYAPGHPDYTEGEGDFPSSEAYRYLAKVANELLQNPAQRTFIVDHEDAKCTEDSVWLSLPKWQHDHDLPSIYWHVVTERSIEKSVFREIFADCEWSIEHGEGPRGTTFVSKYVYGDENDGPEAHTVVKRHYGTLFSDQPEVVAQQGLECGDELYQAARRFGTFPKPVVRIFRCAPRESLIEGVTRVLKQQHSDNVFNIWIRHSEAPEKMLQGFGKYEFQVDDTSRSPLELLTSIIVSDEAADDGTVVSISSPMSAEKYHKKSSLHVSVPKEIPEIENDTEMVSPLNSTDVHIDATGAPQFSVESLLTPSMTSIQNVTETPNITLSAAITPKRGSSRRSSSSNSDNDEENDNIETETSTSFPSKADTEQKKKDSAQKTFRKSPASTPAKSEQPKTSRESSPVAHDSTPLSKGVDEPVESVHKQETTEQPVNTGKKTPARKKRSKKKSKSPTRSPQLPNYHEEKKDVDGDSPTGKSVDSRDATGLAQNDSTMSNEAPKDLVCKACRKPKKKNDYSKAQLRKKEERRCTECIQDQN
ncbi:hypothetical protein FisN_1Hh570 [Fistulifera solaris]|uniref:Stc1 domain-containing protein n=1 Tax=Fistulifera solaris TaxID=1519565 RepID=A0A1Z5KQT0_FISSO|nr:hypothetical protein FisN_1Hh570 [Fistulifera solaris]|eukprot:GAX28639.1 hypothetical protein FisN_1Hh570 [Fistulifera solaris]